MTDDELRGFAGQWIEATMVDGTMIVGRLLVDEPHALEALLNPFEIEQPSADPEASAPRINIESSMLVLVRSVAAPPQTLD